MYNVKKDKKYYMYSFYKGYAIEFKDFNKLINYVRLKNSLSYNGKYFTNVCLDNISLNQNDTITYYYRNKYEVSKREFLFYDEDFRILDLRLYKDLILNEDNKIEKIKSKKGYIFRKTPVCRIHKRKKEGIYKQNRTKYLKEMKDNEKVEENYLRKKRVSKLNNYRDRDTYKTLSYSWKDQSKKRKQWQ